MSDTEGRLFDGFRRNVIAFSVTREMAIDHGLVTPTPAEKAARDAATARWREYDGRCKRADKAMLAAFHMLNDRTANAVLDLHKPTGGAYPECEGDDFSGSEAERPEWPCRTVIAIAKAHGIPTREDVKR